MLPNSDKGTRWFACGHVPNKQLGCFCMIEFSSSGLDNRYSTTTITSGNVSAHFLTTTEKKHLSFALVWHQVRFILWGVAFPYFSVSFSFRLGWFGAVLPNHGCIHSLHGHFVSTGNENGWYESY